MFLKFIFESCRNSHDLNWLIFCAGVLSKVGLFHFYLRKSVFGHVNFPSFDKW